MLAETDYCNVMDPTFRGDVAENFENFLIIKDKQ